MNEQYATQIIEFPLLRGFTPAGAEMLLQSGEIKHYAKGDVIFKEGDPPSFTLLLLAGVLQVFMVRSERELILNEPEPGTILGELAVICGIPRSASLRAKTDSVVVQWKAQEFGRLLVRHTLFSERVLGQSLRNLIEKERSIVDSLVEEQSAKKG